MMNMNLPPSNLWAGVTISDEGWARLCRLSSATDSGSNPRVPWFQIAKQAIHESGLPKEEFDLKKTPVSTVIFRRGVNLERAARLAISTLDPDQDLEEWYAFGRAADGSMAYDLKVEFVCVDPKASKGTWDYLSKLA